MPRRCAAWRTSFAARSIRSACHGKGHGRVSNRRFPSIRYLVSTLLRRAVARSTAEDFAGALNDCNTAIGIDSARPEAYCGRGMIYAMKLEFAKAIEDFTRPCAGPQVRQGLQRARTVYRRCPRSSRTTR